MTEPLSRSPAIASYQFVLSEEPAHWSLYGRLAALLPTPSEQSHVYLQGAWRALERREYIQAGEFSAAAERVYGRTFRSRLIDVELLKRQGQGSTIPKKLLEIADTFKQKNLPSEEVKAYKRLSLLDPNPAYYERIINLYATVGKQDKATLWVQKLAHLKPPTVEKPLVPLPSPLPDIAFGKALWAKYFGDVGEEPPLPPDIDEILNSSCHIWPDKKVRETHLLVLVPQTVTITTTVKGGFFSKDKTKTEMQQLTLQLNLKTLGELVQKPLQGEATKYGYVRLGEYEDLPALKSQWALMTRDVIPGSRNKKYGKQQAQVATLREKTNLSYEVPTVLDAAVCIFMEYVRTGIRLYSDDPQTYIRCQEKYDGKWQLVVGGFAPGGLSVFNNGDNSASGGVAVLRKFSYAESLRLAASQPSRPASSESKAPAPALSPRPVQQQLPDIAFGKALWAKFFGDVGEEPPLPPDIDKILNSSCPIWDSFFNRKKVRDTHLLVLVPQTMNGKPLTLKTLGKLVQKPLQGKATKYGHVKLGEYEDLPALKSHWALMSRDVIPGSRSKSYQKQHAQVLSFREKIKLPYEVPTVLDATVCIFMEYFRTGTYLYGQDPQTFTRCQEKYDDTWNLVVGGFAPGGLSVRYDCDYDYYGVGVLRKFF